MDKLRRVNLHGGAAVVLIALTAIFALYYNVWTNFGSNVGYLPAAYHRSGHSTVDTNKGSAPRVSLVLASTKEDNTTWAHESFSHWDLQIYVVDDLTAPLHTAQNKGREGNVYLTHIIDNYDNLADVSIFHHADRYQWHTDDPIWDGKRLLENLQLTHVETQGYASLKCSATFTCKDVLNPDPDVDSHEADIWWQDVARAFEELFPGDKVPDDIAATCCAEFAVSRAQIRKRPKSDYIRYRDWLLRSDLDDIFSGRVFEYTWHLIFMRPAVWCPEPKSCYCQTFGLCDLDCGDHHDCKSCDENGDNCRAQYMAPFMATLPKGWPEFGFGGEKQNVSCLEDGGSDCVLEERRVRKGR